MSGGAEIEYGSAWAVEAEGGRIGIVTCPKCGAALVLDRYVDVLKLHSEWHADHQQEPMSNE